MSIEKCYKEALCNVGTRKVLAEGVSIVTIDGSREYIYYLEEGLCALAGKDRKGQEIIYSYLQKGSLLGAMYYGIKEKKYSNNEQIYFITKKKCTVYEISYKAIHMLRSQKSQIGIIIAQAMSQHFLNLLHHLHSTYNEETSIRMCRMFLDLARFEDESYVLDKYFRYNEIAKYLGVHKVTIARIMQELKNQDIIQKRGQQIVFKDKKKLEEMINQYNGTEYQTYI